MSVGALCNELPGPPRRIASISNALFATREHDAISAGIREITLDSTLTTRRFYLRCGYVPAGEPGEGFGLTQAYPMSKQIAL